MLLTSQCNTSLAQWVYSKGRYARAVYTGRIHGPYIRPVYTGAFLTPVYTARTYGPYIRVVRTEHPYIRPVYTARTKKAFLAMLFDCTARIYGWCVLSSRIYGPYKSLNDQS